MRFIKTIVVKAWNWLVGLFNVGRRLFEQYVIAPIKQTTLYMKAAAMYECMVTANKLRSMSPVASGQLANSWQVKAAVTQNGGVPSIQVHISNTAPNSFFRIVGRAPGRMPPTAAIRQWCQQKGIDPAFAFPIARSIGEQGTFRWRTRTNLLNYDRVTGVVGAPNIWTETVTRIENQLRV